MQLAFEKPLIPHEDTLGHNGCSVAARRGKASKGKAQVPENVEYRALRWRLCRQQASNDVPQQVALGCLQSRLLGKVGEMVHLWLCYGWVHLPLTLSGTM